MRVGDDAAAAAEGNSRRVQHLGKLDDFIARMDGAAADKDHRVLAGLDQRGRSLDAIGIRGGRRQGGVDLRLTDLGTLGEHIPRHFQRRRPAPARQHFLKGTADHGGRDIGILGAIRPFDESAERCELVGHFVQMAAALAEKLRRHLAGQAQHRLVAAEGGEQRRARIEHAGTRHHTEHTGPSAGARVAERHIAAGLLVPCADDLELRLMEGVEQSVDLRARQTKNGIDAVRHKAVDDGFSTGRCAHALIQSVRVFRRRRRCAGYRRLRPRPR